LREFCEAAGIGYVFAVPVDHQLTTSGRVRMRADQALALVEPEGWNRRSCGAGAKGRRCYDWAWIATDHPRRWLLIRRTISDPSELAYFCAYAPRAPCLLADRPSRDRWDEMEGGRRFPGLKIHRRTRPDPGQALPGLETPRHLGDGCPRVPRRVAAIERAAHPAPVLPDHRDQLPPADCGIIALTVPEAQRLFHLLTTFTHNLPPHTVRDRITPHLSWSDWRRRHQARARWHHYRTRLTVIA
jgi:hypothetical protein